METKILYILNACSHSGMDQGVRGYTRKYVIVLIYTLQACIDRYRYNL